MSVDWSKYPPLPKPPKLPEWRDKPEHEAYWEDVEEIRTPLQNKWGCGGMFALWILSAAIFNHWLWGNNWDDIFARIITGGTNANRIRLQCTSMMIYYKTQITEGAAHEKVIFNHFCHIGHFHYRVCRE